MMDIARVAARFGFVAVPATTAPIEKKISWRKNKPDHKDQDLTGDVLALAVVADELRTTRPESRG